MLTWQSFKLWCISVWNCVWHSVQRKKKHTHIYIKHEGIHNNSDNCLAVYIPALCWWLWNRSPSILCRNISMGTRAFLTASLERTSRKSSIVSRGWSCASTTKIKAPARRKISSSLICTLFWNIAPAVSPAKHETQSRVISQEQPRDSFLTWEIKVSR